MAPPPSTLATPSPPEPTVLAPMDVGARMGRLRESLGGLGVPVLLVTSLTNLRYLTGFTGSAGMLLVDADAAVLVTDGRYGTQAAEQTVAAGVDVRIEVAPAVRQGEVVKGLVGSRHDRLGLEAAHVSWNQQRTIASEWVEGSDVVPTVGAVETLRQVKDRGELDRLARAATIADHALASVASMLGDAPAERDFALALDTAMHRLGASGPSFETIVASGPNAAKPHHRPGDRRIGTGEPVVLDFGARYDGYCSDMTRTVSVGPVTDPELRRAIDVVFASQAAGVAAVRPGIGGADVDRVCRDVIAGAGLGEQFVHSTGHGVGLDVHEAPSVGSASTDTLGVGHVVTVEPGVYLPGLGGVRIEDTVVVTADGATPLTLTPKERC